jgi:hypothetical protein
VRSLMGWVAAASLAVVPAFAADWEAPPLASPPAAANPFLGAYAALGGAYGVGSARSFSVTSSSGGLGSDPGLFGNASPAGWSGIAAAGYNMTFGPALIGIELDGRLGDEKFARDGAAANTNSVFGPAGAIFYRYNFSNEAGLHLSGRLGAVFGDTLIFGKFGAGASQIKDGFAADQTGAFRCLAVNTNVFPAACVGPTAGGAGSFTQTRWVPSLIFGAGTERNVGAFFMRGAVEAEMLTQDTFSITQPTAPAWSFTGTASSPNTQWTVRANVMAGVRF